MRSSVVTSYTTTTTDGKKYKANHYNLNVITSVGYRLKSLRGTQFRIWASSTLKEYMKKGYMGDQKVIENKEKPWNQLYSYLKKEDNNKFNYLKGVSFSTFVILIWQFLKIIYYIYMRGKFSVYGIDSCYIVMKEENVLFQIIKIIGIGTMVFITNYIVYGLLVKEEKNKKKYYFLNNILRLLIWLIFVMFSIVFIITLLLDITIIELVIDFKYNPKEWFLLMLVIFMIVIMINLIGLEFGFEKIVKRIKRRYILGKEYKKYKKNKSVNKDKLRKHGYIISISNSIKVSKKPFSFYIVNTLLVIAGIVIILFIIWYIGKDMAKNQKNYKVIFEPIEDVNIKSYILQDDEDKYICYPIIFETEDRYILTRLAKADDVYSLDYTYQKIIDKDGIQTFKIQDIKDAKLVHSIYRSQQ